MAPGTRQQVVSRRLVTEFPYQVRLLFGLDPRVPYNESNLYNLYKQAFKRANFKSNIKVHLPRHMLGYHQEKMGYVVGDPTVDNN